MAFCVHRSDVLDELQNLGLTRYEARCYVSLAALGPADPAKVADDADIPKPSAYTALRGLASKGWADLVVKKPATYRAKEPSGIKSMVEARVEETFDALDRLYSPQPTLEAELVYTIRGGEKVLAKIYELLRGAKETVMLVAPAMGLEDAKTMELLSEALERGVSVRAICDEGGVGLLPPGVDIRTGNQVAFDLLVDDKVALIGLPDHSACGWIDSPAVASHFKQFIELLWSTSSPP
ncbi:MAG: TrmB family transcriptional regulator [Nitrososphaerota archaeon]|jgi:sugar-specific transcriptional regulator TrmB|nr:TrmB family transcriptional regulator [Nitrososphaerota archaeon]